MERLTRKSGGVYIVDITKVERSGEAFAGEAIERLARFENMLERLVREREETAGELERLRREGREKSVTFKQLLARKLSNSSIMAMFETHGLN